MFDTRCPCSTCFLQRALGIQSYALASGPDKVHLVRSGQLEVQRAAATLIYGCHGRLCRILSRSDKVYFQDSTDLGFHLSLKP